MGEVEGVRYPDYSLRELWRLVTATVLCLLFAVIVFGYWLRPALESVGQTGTLLRVSGLIIGFAFLYSLVLQFGQFRYLRRSFLITSRGMSRWEGSQEVWQYPWDDLTLTEGTDELISTHPRPIRVAIQRKNGENLGELRLYRPTRRGGGEVEWTICNLMAQAQVDLRGLQQTNRPFSRVRWMLFFATFGVGFAGLGLTLLRWMTEGFGPSHVWPQHAATAAVAYLGLCILGSRIEVGGFMAARFPLSEEVRALSTGYDASGKERFPGQ